MYINRKIVAQASIDNVVTICDREPIKSPGFIQGHGLLIIVDPQELKILQIAGDFSDIPGISKICPGGDVVDFLPSRLIDDLQLEKNRHSYKIHPSFNLSTDKAQCRLYDILSYERHGALFLELEPSDSNSTSSHIGVIDDIIHESECIDNLGDYINDVVRRFQSFSGYDHVMFYQFKDDLSGEVVAEIKTSAVMKTYLGLRFPASDIPSQARELYIKNRVRYIADVRNNPVHPIIPTCNPMTGMPTDLGDSFLRSISAVHVEYLRNMGVSASLSISVVIDDKLWGMLICHHLSGVKYPHMMLRSSLLMLSRVLSSNIHRRIESLAVLDASKAQELMIGFAASINNRVSSDIRLNLVSNEKRNIIDLIPADGAVFILDGTYQSIGRTLSRQQTNDLIIWLSDKISSENPLYFTDSLSLVYPPAKDYIDIASGILVFSVSGDLRDMVILFRKEIIHTVCWAGKPDLKDHLHPDDTLRLTPRKSFDLWVDSVKGMSLPWEKNHTEIAQVIRSYLLAERNELLKRQEVIELIANNAEAAIVVDEFGVIVFSNESAKKASGFEDGADLHGLNIDLLIPPRLASGREQNFRGILNDFFHCETPSLEYSGLFFIVSHMRVLLPVYITFEKVTVDLDGYVLLIFKDGRNFLPSSYTVNPSVFAEHTDLPVVIMDPLGHIEWVNNAFTQLTYYDLEESQSSLLLALLGGVDLDQGILKKFDQSILEKKKLEIEMQGYKKNLQPFCLRILLEPVRGIGDNISHYISYLADITREKNIEQQDIGKERALDLLLRREPISKIMESVVSTFATTDGSVITAVITFDVNHQILSFIKSDFFPQSIERLLISCSQEAFMDVYQSSHRFMISDINQKSCVDTISYKLYVEGFRSLWVEPIVDYKINRALGFLFFARKYSYVPIAAEIRSINNIANFVALAILRQDVDRDLFLCKGLIEDSADPMYIIDPERNFQFVFANPACCVQLDYTIDDLRALQFSDVFYTLDEGDCSDILNDLMSGVHIVFLGIHKKGNGDTFPVEVSANKVVFSQDEMIIANFRDISERIASENILKEAVFQSQRLAQARNQFVANMSHEIRTPMNGIIGLLQLAQNQQLPPLAQEYLDKAYTSSMSLLNILNGVLDFSKIEQGVNLISPREFSLQSLVNTLNIGFYEEALIKGVNFSIDVVDGVPDNLIGDDFRIIQILRNLIGNAVKFTDKGFVKLIIANVGLELNKINLSFKVVDSGIGIPDQALEHIFEPFCQADDSITRRFGGTGLGLSIVRGLLLLMGSDISVVSSSGAGSIFSFILELEAVPLNSDGRLITETSQSGILDNNFLLPSESLSSKKILLAEDNEINQLVISRLLEISGMECVIVSDGKSAFEAALSDNYDLILMDLHMPVMGGIEAVKNIRAIPRLSNVPIIALTADVAESERENCFMAGMNDFLTKPISSSELMNVLLRWINLSTAIESDDD